jgi:hypothetical protein
MAEAADPRVDDDIASMDCAAAQREAQKLRDAIRWFLTREGQDLCWDNFNDLGDFLPEKLHPYPQPDDPLAMMEGCVKFCQFVFAAKAKIDANSGRQSV